MFKLKIHKQIKDIPNYMKSTQREIKIDTITPQIADTIDETIRFWNIKDEEKGLLIGEREPIKIYINSLGGSISSALEIIDSIKMSKTPIYTFNISTVCGESFLIYLAGHKRFTYQNSTFMYKDSIFETTTKEENENESTFYNKNTIVNEIKKRIKMLFLEKVNITEAQYDKHSKNEWWFSADDAFKLHISNEIQRKHYYINKKH